MVRPRCESKQSIPRRLMDHWQDWRNRHGYVPQVSHAALLAFTRMSAMDRVLAISDWRAWECGEPLWPATVQQLAAKIEDLVCEIDMIQVGSRRDICGRIGANGKVG